MRSTTILEVPQRKGQRAHSESPEDAAPPSPVSGYRPALDGIRGLAVLAVMVTHAFPQYAGGGFGVDVFFCLSGFLITSLLLAEWRATGGVRLRQFWIRRALRLLPALALVLVAVGLYAAYWAPQSLRHETLSAIPSVVGYWANWRRAIGHHTLGLLGPTWSLAVEEQFYLVWPLLLVVVLRVSRRPFPWLLAITLAGAVFALATRIALGIGRPGTSLLRLNGADARADQLLIGCALAILCAALSPRALRHLARALAVLFPFAVALFACLIAVGPTLWFTPTVMYGGGFTLVALSSAVVVGHVSLTPAGVAAKVLSMGPLPGIGRISYGLYLWHFPVFVLVALNFHTSNPLFRGAAEFAAAFAVAVTSFLVLERPLLRLKGRFRTSE